MYTKVKATYKVCGFYCLGFYFIATKDEPTISTTNTTADNKYILMGFS